MSYQDDINKIVEFYYKHPLMQDYIKSKMEELIIWGSIALDDNELKKVMDKIYETF